MIRKRVAFANFITFSFAKYTVKKVIYEMRSREVVLFATPGSALQRVLGDGVGSVNRRRPLKPLEEHVGVCQKATNMLLRIFQMPKNSAKWIPVP